MKRLFLVGLFSLLLLSPSYAQVNRDMSTVHDDLRKKTESILSDVNKLCPSGWQLAVFETSRTKERQKKLYDAGKSKTLNSKHMKSPAEAVDVVWKKNGNWTWDAPELTNSEDGWAYLESLKGDHNLRIISWDKPHLELK